MAQQGTTSGNNRIYWYAGTAPNYLNDATTDASFGNYLSKTDNGFYLVKFKYVNNSGTEDEKIIAVRNGLEVLSEAQKAITGTQISADISTLRTQVTAFIASGQSIPTENVIGV